MTERILGIVLLICALLSALVMWVVQVNISSTQEAIKDDSPEALNYLLQTDHNLDLFIDSVHELQLHPTDTATKVKVEQKLRDRFDVAWSSFYIYDMQFPAERTSAELVKEFRTNVQNFLDTTEQLIAPGSNLTDVELAGLMSDSRIVSNEIRRLGHGYFIEATKETDVAQKQLESLTGYMRLFMALLLATGGLGVGLLVRSNIKTNATYKEAQQARSELAYTVDELRSGRREQRSKDSFIASATHDLRQPLHALGLFLNSLKTEVKPNGERALNEAIQCNDALNRLFNSMLDLSRLDAGVVTVVKEDFDLSETMEKLYAQLNPIANGHGIDLTLEGIGGACVETDPILLGRILRNLVDNAITHSGATKLTLHYSSVRNGYKVAISDNGQGIAEDEQKAVFSEYYQIGNPERDRSEGLGLGLSIVKRLSELLELDLTLDSKPGHGTTFTVVVPAGEEIVCASSDRNSGNATGVETVGDFGRTTVGIERSGDAQPVILVVDDDRSIREAMAMTLDFLNYIPVCAEYTDDALEQLAERQLEPDLIIADYRLRDHLTGDQVIYELREAIERNIPGLIITGDTSPARVSEMMLTGLEIMHKPVEADALQDRIQAMLNLEEVA